MGAPEKFRIFCENKLYVNSVKKYICNVKISRPEHALPTSEKDGVISSFRGVFIFVSFAKIKPLRKCLNL